MTESLTPGCGLSVAPGSDEDTPRRPPVRDTEELGQDTYGPLKVACEDDVLARYGSRATIVRPGKVAGPFDPQDGLTWARRAALGGRVALPGAEDQPVQIIDSRDLGRLVVQLIADDRPGAFHAVGPAEPVTLGGLIRTCARVAGTQAEVVPVPAEAAPPFFPLIRADWPSQQRGAGPGRRMPATPLAVTAADVLAWDRERGEPPLAGGFSPEQERAVLALTARTRGGHSDESGSSQYVPSGSVPVKRPRRDQPGVAGVGGLDPQRLRRIRREDAPFG